MIQIMQNIIFPDDASLYTHWGLFYKGGKKLTLNNQDENIMFLNKYSNVEFSTYFNGLSINKWKKYTNINTVSIVIEAEGEFDLFLCGYSISDGIPKRTELKKHHIEVLTKTTLKFDFPLCEEQMLSFELETYKDTKLYGGYYEGDFNQETLNKVELALATTTCWKEKFIIKNIERLHCALQNNSFSDINKHLTIHIIDNGRTLKKDDFPKNENIKLHPNKNTGGSGGFSRGMLEAKKQYPIATHILLMDDDVLVMPDSIFRTFALLRTLKKEYINYFISGAMLLMEEMNVQLEDIGTVKNDGTYVPLKPRLYHHMLYDNLINEMDYEAGNQYQGWWYCCIPMTNIECYGLPLPFFIRVDDCEYSLRSKAQIISMNGICVWHMGFYGKFSASMNIYQECRNLLIAQATTDVLPEANLINRIKKFYRDNILKHDYNAAELSLCALEDFMKGPEYLQNLDGEKKLKENAKLNHKMEPIEHFKGLNIDYQNPYWDCPRKFLKKWIYRITFNGHRFYSKNWLNKEVVAIPFDFGYTPGKMALKETYLAVNPIQKSACIKKIDKTRFKELQKRYIIDILYYKKNKKRIIDQYRAAKEYLVSVEFWEKYLDLL